MNLTPKDIVLTIKDLERNWGSVESATRGKYVAIALGAVAASVLPLPSSPVVNVTNHWIMQHEANLNRLFSDINESYLFNIKLAAKVARQTYLARYRRVYDPTLILSELALLMPEHVSKMPVEVEEVFTELSEKQKHFFNHSLITMMTSLLGGQQQ